MLGYIEFQGNFESSKKPTGHCIVASRLIPKAGEKQGRSKGIQDKAPMRAGTQDYKAILEGGLLGNSLVQPGAWGH
jgi:hypothetical protein